MLAEFPVRRPIVSMVISMFFAWRSFYGMRIESE